jgi:hypothetical protein
VLTLSLTKNQLIVWGIVALLAVSFVVQAFTHSKLLAKPMLLNQSLDVKEAAIIWHFMPTGSLNNEFVVLDSGMTYAYKEFTAAGFIALNHNNYDEFKRLEAQGSCPASFLNSNSMLYLVLTENNEVVETLNNVKRGDILQVQGLWLNFEKRFAPDSPSLVFNIEPPQKSTYLFVETVKNLGGK